MKKRGKILVFAVFFVISLILSMSFSLSVQDSEIIAYLSFNDTSVPPIMQNFSNIALVNGVVGNSFSFNGVNSSVNISTTLIFSEGTLEALINPSSQTTGIIIFSGASGSGFSNEAIHLNVNSNGHFNFFAGSGYQLSSSNTYSLNNWYHLIATYKNGSSGFVKLYVNGEKVAENNTGFSINYSPLVSPILVGRPIGNTNFFNGLIDEVKLYKKALTEDEVRQEYSSYARKAGPGDFCRDTDQGVYLFEEEYYIKGTINYSISGQNYTATDMCINSTTLLEYFCQDNLNYSATYGCLKGCSSSSNSCLGNVSFNCIDSDNGINYSVQGFVNFTNIDNSVTTYTDLCLEDTDDNLFEYFCSGKIINSTKYKCPKPDFNCSAGKCIRTQLNTTPRNNTPLTPECTEDECTEDGLLKTCANGFFLPPERVPGKCENSQCSQGQIMCEDGVCRSSCSLEPEKPKSKLWIIILIIFVIAVLVIIGVIFFVLKKKNKGQGPSRTSTQFRPSQFGPGNMPPRFPQQNLVMQKPTPNQNQSRQQPIIPQIQPNRVLERKF